MRSESNQLRKIEVLKPLVPLVDGYFDRVDLLKSKGWFSFEPYWKFRRSLCTEEDWIVHKKLLLEQLKRSLGYHSILVDNLKKELGEERYSSAPTICEEKYWSLWYKRGEYNKLWEPYRLEQMALRDEEVVLHSSPVTQKRIEIDENHKRIGIWRDVVSETAARLGFHTKAKLTSRSAPVFRHELNKQWQVVIGVDHVSLGRETAESIAKPPDGRLLPIGGLGTWLALVPTGTRIANSNPTMIYIPQVFFPFDKAYDNFWDMKGLEINIRARMEALELVWPVMRPLLVECVQEEVS